MSIIGARYLKKIKKKKIKKIKIKKMFHKENFYYRQYFYKNRYMTLDVILNFDFGIISSAIFER